MTLEGSVTGHDLLGLSLGAVYTVTLSCVFLRDGQQRVTLPCGSRTLVTSLPDLLEADTVLRRLEVARSWSGSEAQCLGGGGHLVSLGRDLDTEELIQQRLGLSDWWTGGNICPDSPGNNNLFQTFIHPCLINVHVHVKWFVNVDLSIIYVLPVPICPCFTIAANYSNKLLPVPPTPDTPDTRNVMDTVTTQSDK